MSVCAHGVRERMSTCLRVSVRACLCTRCLGACMCVCPASTVFRTNSNMGITEQMCPNGTPHTSHFLTIPPTEVHREELDFPGHSSEKGWTQHARTAAHSLTHLDSVEAATYPPVDAGGRVNHVDS